MESIKITKGFNDHQYVRTDIEIDSEGAKQIITGECCAHAGYAPTDGFSIAPYELLRDIADHSDATMSEIKCSIDGEAYTGMVKHFHISEIDLTRDFVFAPFVGFDYTLADSDAEYDIEDQVRAYAYDLLAKKEEWITVVLLLRSRSDGAADEGTEYTLECEAAAGVAKPADEPVYLHTDRVKLLTLLLHELYLSVKGRMVIAEICE